jgi:NAD+ synthase (glutamine-hydrolysing)
MFGFYRIAAVSPLVKVADIRYNTTEITASISKAKEQGAAAVLFPELSITSYSCADLFKNSTLLEESEKAILEITEYTEKENIIAIVGAPLRRSGRLYSCAVVIQNGKILGVVPKIFLPNYREFYEARWFASGKDTSGTISIGKAKVPFGEHLIFEYDNFFSFGIELCEDLWNVIPPSSNHALAGANLIFNLSASNELVAKADYRKQLITGQSARCVAGYIYASAGTGESTTDVVYGGHLIAAENGVIVAENSRFQQETSIITADIDCEKLFNIRMTETSFDQNQICEYRTIQLEQPNSKKKIDRRFTPHPFVPANPAERSIRCREIFNIQQAALAKRVRHTNAEKVVIGISGGLDSTLALLVIEKTLKMTGNSPENIITVTMPGFGTTDRTYDNAVALCKILGTDLRKIDIKDACLNHFKDIGHDPDIHDVTYENVQARERTQILMDIANREKGILAGTGDLSEIALGWSTYNADHMSMYSINCGVPKTLIRYLISWVADHSDKQLSHILYDIIDTPVSPELLPKCKKEKSSRKQKRYSAPMKCMTSSCII